MEHPRYIIDEHGNRVSVIISVAHFDSLVEDAEMLDDIKAARDAGKDAEESIPWEQAQRELGLESEAPPARREASA